MLTLHRGSKRCDLAAVEAVAAPPSTETWYPLSHGTVLHSTLELLQGAGYRVTQQALSLSSTKVQFFGVLDLDMPIVEGVKLSVGIRNSIDRSIAISLAMGERVFVCDNLAFFSDIVISKKHTINGLERFREAAATAIQGIPAAVQGEQRRIEVAQAVQLSRAECESAVARAFYRGLISSHWIRQVLDRLEQNSTLWALEQAFTSATAAMRESSPRRYCSMILRLHKLLQEYGD